MESQRYPCWILMATNARWAAYLEGSVPTFVGGLRTCYLA